MLRGELRAACQRSGAASRRYRIERRFSQEALADATGIDRSHMGRIERGERNLTILNPIRIGTSVSAIQVAAYGQLVMARYYDGPLVFGNHFSSQCASALATF
jgi:DNA-binding XRE family transcriptional regulator